MAHKKGGGSTRNGRDTASQRLGVKRADGQYVVRAPSWCANAVPSSGWATTSVSARITRSTPRSTVWSASRRLAGASAASVCTRQRFIPSVVARLSSLLRNRLGGIAAD